MLKRVLVWLLGRVQVRVVVDVSDTLLSVIVYWFDERLVEWSLPLDGKVDSNSSHRVK